MSNPAAPSALTLVDEDFRAGGPACRAPPTRFHLNLSERCQLRCAHCITDAPARTRSGAAREMPRPVLDALRPHLEHACYVAFTHAGEPMLAPLFVPALEALREARGGQPTVVHLLTNGMALSEERFLDFARLGVTSLSFSLDGMSEGSNDLLRIGGRVSVLLPRIRAIAELRAKEGLDVRLGIGWTLTRQNAGELEDLLRFASDAGLDWVKLEEMFPQNPAAGEARLDAFEQEGLVARAQATAAALPVKLLDHTRSVEVWKCRLMLEKRMRRVSALDDLANRTDINACRLPYEQVCVEPNGDVRPVTFHHPVAGNVLEQGLLDLWNGPVFAEVRREQRARRLCGQGPATCPSDAGPGAW